MLGEFDADAQLDVVEEGIEAGLIALTRLGEDLQHGIEPRRIDPPDEQVATEGFELVEQPLPAPNRPPPTLERIADSLQGEEALDAGNAGWHGGCRGTGGTGLAGNDEVATGRAAGAAAARHSRYARIAVDPHQTHLVPVVGKICRRRLSNG